MDTEFGQKLGGYIRDSLAQGKSKEEIYRELLERGEKIEAIQEAFFQVESPKEEKEDVQKKTVRLILVIGVVLVGAGIFSFIAANWQEIPKATKISLILMAMLTSYSAGWFLKEEKGNIKTGEALLLLGSIIYGAGIFLVAQMFNIRANWPDGFILWMLGTIIMAFAMNSFSLFYLAIPAGVVAIIGHPFDIFRAFPGYDPFLLTSSALLLFAAIITFFAGWLVRKQMPPELKEFY